MAEENQEEINGAVAESGRDATATERTENGATAAKTATRAHRSQKVGAVVSDKMQKTVVVRARLSATRCELLRRAPCPRASAGV